MEVFRVALAPSPSHGRGNGAGRANGKARIAATYDYRDAKGSLTFQTVRLEPKGFYQRRPDGKGGWINNLEGVSPLPYRLPDVLRAVQQGRRIYIVEGEIPAGGLTVLYGDSGSEVCNQYLAKGRQVLVEGEVDVSAYLTEDGEARATLEVTARNVVFLGAGNGDKPPRPTDEELEEEREDIPF
jgi:hypothetical protein